MWETGCSGLGSLRGESGSLRGLVRKKEVRDFWAAAVEPSGGHEPESYAEETGEKVKDIASLEV